VGIEPVSELLAALQLQCQSTELNILSAFTYGFSPFWMNNCGSTVPVAFIATPECVQLWLHSFFLDEVILLQCWKDI